MPLIILRESLLRHVRMDHWFVLGRFLNDDGRGAVFLRGKERDMGSHKMKGWVVVLLAFALVASACAADDDTVDTTAPAPAPTTTAVMDDGGDEAPAPTTTTTAVMDDGGDEAPAPTTTTTAVMDDDSTTETTAASTDGDGVTLDTLNIHVGEFATLNPFLSSGIGRGTVTAVIYQPLVFIGPDNTVHGGAAESWEISGDGLTITFHLRDDLIWSDGEPFTSEDVLWSISKYLTADLSLWANRIGGVLGQGEGDVPAGLSAPDDHTFVVQLAGSNPPWLSILAAQGFVISMLPEHVLGGMSNEELATTEYFNEAPVTLGPYKFVRWERDQFVELEADPNWPAPVAFDRVRFSLLQTDVATAQLETEDLHLSTQIAPLDVARLQALDNVVIQTVTGVWPEVLQFFVDQPELADPRVRQAMAYALDLEGLCREVLVGYCTVTRDQVRLLAPAWAIPTEGMIVYEYNPDRARELLAEAGWDSGTKLTLLNIGGQDRIRNTESVIIQANFAAVGISLNVLATDVGTLLDIGRNADRRGEIHMFLNRGAHFSADPNQVSPYNSCHTHYPNGANLSWFCRDDLDALWERGLQVASPEERAPIYHEAFRILNADIDSLNLYWPETIVAHASALRGVQPVGQPEHVTWNIADWTWGG